MHDPQIWGVSQGSNNRSKFNVALGVEGQGFCVLR
jgi:hypothetical protein